jgi:hypothetical protein
VSFSVIGDLVAHAWPERECSAVFELGMKLTFRAQKDVALDAPMIGSVPGRVLDHPDADGSEVLGSPVGAAALAFVFGSGNL